MKFRLIVLGLAAGLLGVAGCRRNPVTVSPKAVPVRADGTIELRVLTFNVRYENPQDAGARHWRQRIIGALRMIRREQPDIIGVQEALHGQAADLWASLPDYGFFGVGRSDGLKTGEYAGIFYQRSRLMPDPADQGTFWLSDQPNRVGSRTWGNEIPRIAAWVRLKDRATGRGFYVFNTHWDHRSQGARERSALLLATRIDARAHPEEPVVLTGDFNSTETNPAVAYLTGKPVALAGQPHRWSGRLLDTYQIRHPADTNRRTLHLWSGSREGQLKVDHIFVSPEARVDGAEIVSVDQPMISDHFPVSARVRFPLQR